jgi:hypothetical protein
MTTARHAKKEKPGPAWLTAFFLHREYHFGNSLKQRKIDL